jgi:hypothetical protein
MTKLHCVTSTLLLFCVATAIADQKAVADDGKKVLLRDNGTWSYLPADTTPAADAPAADHTTLIDIVKNDKQFDFRKAKWGMSKKTVMASESAKLIQNRNDTLEYSVQFLGYNCRVIYKFSGDALSHAAFLVGQDHIDPSLFYTDYEALKKYLVPLFGEPAANRCDWVNEMYRSDKAKWGFAVSLGFLTCSTRWTSGRTGITLLIQGGNHQISTSIEYAAIQN